MHFVLKGDLQTSNKKVKQFINNLSAFMQMLIHKFLEYIFFMIIVSIHALIYLLDIRKIWKHNLDYDKT